MWISSSVNLTAGQGLLLAAAPSFQPIRVAISLLNATLERAMTTLETYQTRPAHNRLKECDELATHVLEPAEGDVQGAAFRSALNSWYIARFRPFLESYEATHHKGVTVQDRLQQELRQVIADFGRHVFTEHISAPPSDHPSSVAHDPHIRPTLRPLRSGTTQLEQSATLSRNTLRLGVQEMRWSRRDSARELYTAVESRLRMHNLKNLVVFYDGSPLELRGLALLLFTEFRVRSPASVELLGSRHVMLVSTATAVDIGVAQGVQVYRRVYYDESEQKFKFSEEEPYN